MWALKNPKVIPLWMETPEEYPKSPIYQEKNKNKNKGVKK